MKTRFHGQFVVGWKQITIDGLQNADPKDIRVGSVWAWRGEAVRIDGPASVLPLGPAQGGVDLRRRAARSVQGFLGAFSVNTGGTGALETDAAPETMTVTNGTEVWTIEIVEPSDHHGNVCLFTDEIPPKSTDLWVVSHTIRKRDAKKPASIQGGQICFTPGTRILTGTGYKPVETLVQGDVLQTKDNGLQELIWTGRQKISGARLLAMPDLAPVRIWAGAVDDNIPDEELLVSPDHRIVIRGAVARALFNSDEVLVCARDLVNDRSIRVDRSVRDVTYHHLLLARHEVVFANGVETESFHPLNAAFDGDNDTDLRCIVNSMPALSDGFAVYGGYARRLISRSEAAILRHDLRH